MHESVCAPSSYAERTVEGEQGFRIYPWQDLPNPAPLPQPETR